jgi:hypothetical protein
MKPAYETVARIIRDEVSVGKAIVASDFARAFAKEDPDFNRAEFMYAAGATTRVS